MRASAKDINTYAHVIDLFAELASLPDDTPAKERLRTEIIESCLPLAENVANRYRGRGQPHDDLVQVARLGLIAAVDRFDLSKGADFLSFAVPTMMGEVRRHFRDRGWAVRVPRPAGTTSGAEKGDAFADPNLVPRTDDHRRRETDSAATTVVKSDIPPTCSLRAQPIGPRRQWMKL